MEIVESSQNYYTSKYCKIFFLIKDTTYVQKVSQNYSKDYFAFDTSGNNFITNPTTLLQFIDPIFLKFSTSNADAGKLYEVHINLLLDKWKPWNL